MLTELQITYLNYCKIVYEIKINKQNYWAPSVTLNIYIIVMWRV